MGIIVKVRKAISNFLKVHSSNLCQINLCDLKSFQYFLQIEVAVN